MIQALTFILNDEIYYTAEIPQELKRGIEQERDRRWFEVRQFPRRAHRVRVEFSTPDGGRFTYYTRDLSLGGVFIETDLPLKLGDELRLTLPMTTGSGTVQVRGEVVRVDDHGIGIAFKRGRRKM